MFVCFGDPRTHFCPFDKFSLRDTPHHLHTIDEYRNPTVRNLGRDLMRSDGRQPHVYVGGHDASFQRLFTNRSYADVDVWYIHLFDAWYGRLRGRVLVRVFHEVDRGINQYEVPRAAHDTSRNVCNCPHHLIRANLEQKGAAYYFHHRGAVKCLMHILPMILLLGIISRAGCTHNFCHEACAARLTV